MRIQQEQVANFHQKHGYPCAEEPTCVSAELAQQRYAFIKEENNEYIQAALSGDLVGIADALGDLLYVVLGAANVHGINLEPIFTEIHRSNMTKTPLDPVTKKGGKGEGYQPPALAGILLSQLKTFDTDGL
jgi:predicted HAD superfamily Cof-like phosphohydrolase